jgi:hypothetical protein
MGMNGSVDPNEVEVRRIAAQKLTEVGALSPDTAILQMSTAARAETDGRVLIQLVNGMAQLISDTTADNIRTEAITTLRVLADPLVQNDVFLLNAATAALKKIGVQRGVIDIGPVTVTSVKKPLPKYFMPLVAITGTALASAGVLWYLFGRTASTQLSAPGPLRRRAEAQRRRRRA